MKRHCYVKDQLFDRASLLPINLVTEANSAKGRFELQILSILSKAQLKQLKKLSEEQKHTQVSLEFFSIAESSKECPKNFKEFSRFKWENLVEIQMHRAQPLQTHADTPAVFYISIVLVVKS